MKAKRAGKRKRKAPDIPEHFVGERLLAIDSSSVAVGWALFQDEQLIDYGKYIQQGEAHGEKLMNYRKWLLGMFKRFKPNHVVVEAPYSGRKAHAFVVLSYYMATVLEMHFNHFGVELPDFNKFPAHLAKRYCDMPKKQTHEENKRLGVRRANDLYGLDLKFKENDRHKKVSDDDIADAVLLGYAWYARTAAGDI